MSAEGLDCWDSFPMEHGCICGNDCPPPAWHHAHPDNHNRTENRT